MRAFVAVEVPSADPRGVGQAPDHLTLRFLGEVAPERTATIVARLEGVAARFSPFEVRIEGIGAFPSVTSPRVVWLGVGRGREALEALGIAVRLALAGEGDTPAEERFVPHLTWFRVRSSEERRAALDALAGRRPVPPPRDVRVEAFVLKESRLGGGGAVHRTLATFPLGRSEGQSAGAPDPSTSRRQR